MALITLTVFFSGCDKPTRLQAEAKAMETQRQTLLIEIESYESRMKSLGMPAGAGALYLTQRADAINAKARATHSQANAKLEKWNSIEKEIQELKTRAEAYKAKHLR